jgi:hypothetical protein
MKFTTNDWLIDVKIALWEETFSTMRSLSATVVAAVLLLDHGGFGGPRRTVVDGQFRAGGHPDDQHAVYPNEHWRCTGCSPRTDDALDVFNQVHTALRHTTRLAYLALDMSWMDRLHQVDARVHVALHDVAHLDRVRPPERERRSQAVPLSEYTEEFQVLAFHFRGRRRAATAGAPPASPATELRRYHAAVDRFLAINPCWVPLHEPANAPVGSAATRTYLIFIRLPSYSYHATCMLYTAVVKRQFPRTCRYTPERMTIYHLANIGFGHTSLFIVNALSAVLKGRVGVGVGVGGTAGYRDGVVFVAPRAQDFLSRSNGTYRRRPDADLGLATTHSGGSNGAAAGGKNADEVVIVDPGPGRVVEGGNWEGEPQNASLVLNGLWAWADPARCDETTYMNDPWACNYIAFTNCSNRVKTTHIKPAELTDWENFFPFLEVHFVPHGVRPLPHLSPSLTPSLPSLAGKRECGGRRGAAGAAVAVPRRPDDDRPAVVQDPPVRVHATAERPGDQHHHHYRVCVSIPHSYSL